MQNGRWISAKSHGGIGREKLNMRTDVKVVKSGSKVHYNLEISFLNAVLGAIADIGSGNL